MNVWDMRPLFSPSVRGRAAEGGRGSFTHHLEFVATLRCRSAVETTPPLVPRPHSGMINFDA